MKKQNGFTLVELIVVIVILGILAATALPRFINVAGDARRAAMNGIAGGMRSAVALAQARYIATGDPLSTSINMGVGVATPVAVVAGSGVPTAAVGGIQAALTDTSGFTFAYAGTTATVTQTGGPVACVVTYDHTTGLVSTAAVTVALCPN